MIRTQGFGGAHCTFVKYSHVRLGTIRSIIYSDLLYKPYKPERNWQHRCKNWPEIGGRENGDSE